MVHIHNGILPINRKKIESGAVRWMALESVIQGEVSQKEKNNYHIVTHTHTHTYTHTHGFWINGTDETNCRAEIEMQM